ncbi:MAG: peptidase S8/S53 domain-containing protein [Monoraphidium minutum]|nr:MAG: peptidase S8/S53 domain-containing protein [Monoraphidium minutum]
MAAGPQGDLVHPTWPANFAATFDKCVIPVAYIDKGPDPIDGAFRLALASNYGESVKIAAPGTDIESTYPRETPTSQTDLGYLTGELNKALWTGSSFAAAHVGGAALLLANSFPGAKNFEIKNCLITTATRKVNSRIDAFNVEHKIKGGLLDVNAAYNCLAKLIPDGPGSGALGDCPGRTVSLPGTGDVTFEGIDFVKPKLEMRGQGPPLKCFLKARGDSGTTLARKEFCFNATAVIKTVDDNCGGGPSKNLAVLAFQQWQLDRMPANPRSNSTTEQGPKSVGRILDSNLCLSRRRLSRGRPRTIYAAVMARDNSHNEAFGTVAINVYRAAGNRRDDCPRYDGYL